MNMKLTPIFRLLFFVVLATQNFDCVSSQKGPILNVPSEWVLYSPVDNKIPLEITCSGIKKLHWETEHVDPEFYTVTENSAFVGYSSTFTIADPVSYDTGNFTCAYQSGQSVTTYVYVFDNETSFVHYTPQGTISVNIGDVIKLDCQTTHPDITVRVFKNNVEDVTDSFEYDRRFIFTKKAKSLQETGIYACKVKGFHSDNSWLVEIQTTPTFHLPSIDDYSNAHYVVGHDFQLNCSIPVSEKNEFITFKWITPNEQTTPVAKRTDDNRPTGIYSISSLTVKNPDIRDSGNYTCIASSGSDKKKVVKEIIIKEYIEPYVEFDVRGNGGKSPPLFVNEHDPDPFQWILYFKGYPNNISFAFYNQFNVTLSENDHRISTDFNYNEGKVSLKIDDIGAEDFGWYTAELSLEDGKSARAHVLVIVNATPKIEFIFVPDVFSHEEAVRLRAKVLSFDAFSNQSSEPTVTWYFNNRCPKGIDSCEAASAGLQLDSTNISKVISNRFVAQLHFNTNSSGIIEARVRNKFGENRTSTHVILSDIGRKFLFKAEIESENVIVNKSMKRDIVEGDRLKLTCASLNYVYENLDFQKLTDRDFLYDKRNSSLSSSYYFTTAEALINMTGNYTCSAKSKMPGGRIDSILLGIRVLKKKSPTILPNSNVTLQGQEVTVKDLKPFNISCYVDGLPKPTITWFKDDVDVEHIALENDQMINMKDDRQVLEFKVAQKAYEGTYKCRAENRAGVVEHSIAIQIQKVSLTPLQWTLIILAIVCITALCSTVGYLTLRVKKERKFREELRQNQLYLFEKGNIGNINPDCTVDEQAELLPYDKRFEVSKERIRLGKMLGCGAFGRVMEAKVDNLEVEGKRSRVAVKMCKDGSDTSQLQALTLELKIMVHLGKHLNIVNLMGAHTGNLDKGDLWILVEYCRYGNLLKFLQKYKSRFVDQIDHETGLIDPERQSNPYHDPRTPLSPGRSSYGGNVWVPIDASGYLETQGRHGSTRSGHSFGRHPSVSSNSGSVTGSSARPGMYVGNPNYVTAAFSRHSSDASTPKGSLRPSSPNGGSMPPYVTAAQFTPKRSPSTKHNRSDSDLNSEDGYHKTLATDMTVLSSPTPFSPSSEAGDFSFDTNTISSDPGEIPGVNAPLTTSDIICWCWQVSSGMEYLTKRKVLHGDLAARNLLLADNNVVKISDFGLSRDIYKNDVYMKKGDGNMPIKWMSPEAIQQKIFSTQSDVWAFGITMWELFTMGNTPYPGVPLDPNFTLCLENGMRNEKPKYATNELYSLMMHCWDKNPIERPSFAEISDMLSDMLSPESKEDYVAMNNVYMNRNEEWMASKEVDYFNLMTSPDFGNFQQSIAQLELGAEDGTYLPESYIPMLVLKSPSEAGDGNRNPSKGYLDMRSVRSNSPPTSASVFSPRPSQPTGNVFDFSGVESTISPDQMSPAETSKLLDNASKSPITPKIQVETEMLLHNPPLTPTSDQLANNNNQLVDSCHEYNNIGKVTVPKYKKKISEVSLIQNDENSLNYVNVSNANDNTPVVSPTTESSYVNTGQV